MSTAIGAVVLLGAVLVLLHVATRTTPGDQGETHDFSHEACLPPDPTPANGDDQ